MIITDISLLRQPCSDVLPEEIEDLQHKLEFELAESCRKGAEGVGLAAPQIGIYKRMAIIRHGEYKLNLVNAHIEAQYDPFLHNGEGCLSFPGLIVSVNRFDEVHISNGVYPEKFIAIGLLAVICQHELEHLRGILLPDVAIQSIPVKTKLRPNDQCNCGSGKKYKKCHGK
jgi:peptide deformylase